MEKTRPFQAVITVFLNAMRLCGVVVEKPRFKKDWRGVSREIIGTGSKV